MLKKFNLSLLVLSFIFWPFFSWADNSLTIQYLQALSPNPWVTQSLAADGVNNLDVSYINPETTDLMTASKYLLALAATESDNWPLVDDLVTVVNSSFNNGQLGSQDLLNDDFWGMLALSAVSEQNHLVEIKNFILSHQNADGGWSWGVGQTSDSNDTAAAIMALSAAGVNSNDQVMLSAVNYLQSTQKANGGLAYDINGEADGASTAWVLAALNKLNIDATTWSINDQTPVSFLNSLAQSDGSFLWLADDTQGSSLVTAYALLALSNATYPVHQITPPASVSGVSLRIESPDNTICVANNLSGSTVLEVLVSGADVCDFTYQVTDTEYGPYVSSIAGLTAQGLTGWQYWQNWQAGAQAANIQTVSAGDEILWAFGNFDILPTQVTASLANDQQLSGQAQYYQDNAWHNLANQQVKIGEQVLTTNDSGQFNTTLNNDGVYPVYLEASVDYIRSPKVYITIGSGISQNVDLSVEVLADNGSGGNQVSFSVSHANINFGQLEAGQIGETILQIHNTGNLALHLEANILGDDLFSQYTSLANLDWLDWQSSLATQETRDVNVKLSLPANIGAGQHSGQLIFWAQAQ